MASSNIPTIKEIAKISGYAISTVSKALNDSYEISNTTKKKIFKIAKKYNYKPNYFASNLKKKENLILGVILPDFKNEYYLNVLSGITEESSKSEHRIMVYHSCNDYNKEKAYIKLLSGNIIDGLIFSPIALKENLVNSSKSTKNNYPTIIINNNNNNNSIWSKFTKAKLNGYDDGKNSVKILVEKIKNQKLNLYAS